MYRQVLFLCIGKNTTADTLMPEVIVISSDSDSDVILAQSDESLKHQLGSNNGHAAHSPAHFQNSIRSSSPLREDNGQNIMKIPKRLFCTNIEDIKPNHGKKVCTRKNMRENQKTVGSPDIRRFLISQTVTNSQQCDSTASVTKSQKCHTVLSVTSSQESGSTLPFDLQKCDNIWPVSSSQESGTTPPFDLQKCDTVGSVTSSQECRTTVSLNLQECDTVVPVTSSQECDTTVSVMNSEKRDTVMPVAKSKTNSFFSKDTNLINYSKGDYQSAVSQDGTESYIFKVPKNMLDVLKKFSAFHQLKV